MDDDFVKLTQNAQFYKPRESILETNIKEILDASGGNKKKDTDYLINEFRINKEFNRIKFTYSAQIFITERPVYFLDESKYKDQIFAFIILIEIDNYLVVLKKSCSSISETINRYFIKIDYKNLAGTIRNSAHFQKLSVRNMTISHRALRAKSYEAEDLVGLFSTHAAGRSIPYYFKVKDKKSVKSITTNSSRITEYSSRKYLDKIINWINEQVKFLKSSTTNKFLNVFANPVNLQEILKKTKPASILIETSQILEILDEEGIDIFYTSKSTNCKRKISENLKSRLFMRLSKAYEIKENVIMGIKSSVIKVNKNSLTFNSIPFHRFTIEVDEKTITLQKYIISKGWYTICFDDPKYMYFMNSCFEDVSGFSELNSIIDIFHSMDGLKEVTSEKGENFENGIFDKKSVFGVVETSFINDDYIICDDMGIEWADHITFNKMNPSISFIHSKHGNESLSASNLHVIVGQAIKNLGNMYFSADEFMSTKRNKLSKAYSNSTIKRLRKGEKKQLKNYLFDLLKNPQLYRKCVLVCSFISKSEITKEFDKIKEGKKVKGNIIQLLWIVSSFVHATKEMNIIPEIHCQP